MAKQEQVLILNPSAEIKFTGPFTDIVQTDLELTNPSPKKVMFKVKTTAPKRYCVRPNSGIIEPGAKLSITLMLQPYNHEQQNEKNKHKFMVQSMFAPDGHIENPETLWKEASPDVLMDSKLRCVFEDPAGSAKSGTGDSNGGIPAPKTKSEFPSQQPNDASANAHVVEKRTSTLSQQVNSSATSAPAKSTLLEEIQSMKSQNAKLNEEKERLRSLALNQSFTSMSTDDLAFRSKGTAVPAARGTSKIASIPVYVIIHVLVFIIGIILGKLLL